MPNTIAILVPNENADLPGGRPALETAQCVETGEGPLSGRESLSRFLQFAGVDDQHLQTVFDVGKARIGVVV